MNLAELCTDLAAEHAALDEVVAGLDADTWDELTPSEPWTIRDQISHLTFFDEAAALAASDPDAFAAALGEAASDIEGYMQAPLDKGRTLEPSEVLVWWRGARSEMLDAFTGLVDGERVPWFGPAMSPASFISARIMETWAHGQDVFDSLGRTREPTERLRHIVHLGVRARGYSYVVRGLPQPPTEVAVVLDAPDGSTWTLGDPEGERIEGSALDFCLLVTQRRHLDDTDLRAVGPAAAEWASIAQCFAGPSGGGRRPGQFRKESTA
jgi:uncharacterized protein (TIGR03084 family)